MLHSQLPLRMLLLSLLACILAFPSVSRAMSLAEYTATYKDKNVVPGKDSVTFYGARIYLDQKQVNFFDCHPLIMEYKGKRLIDHEAPPDYESYCAGGFVEEANIARDFPAKGMVTLAFGMSGTLNRGSNATAFITAWNGKLNLNMMGVHGYVDNVEDIFDLKSGMLKGVNNLWNVCAGGDDCPNMCFNCNGCVAKAIHFMKFVNGKWVDVKPGECKQAYAELYEFEKGKLETLSREKGLGYKALSNDPETSAYFGRNVAHQAWYCLMQGLSDGECLKRIRQYMPKQCARDLLGQLKMELAPQ